ncbi:hypothetical protein CARN8_860002 [mine drainage metagenome]|uniref:Uncharacterized protein n=1 Tax=mine drainage metagenome TaxID=410659 RepID=A0A3P3ZSR8_9ZZZZ
MRQSLKNCRPPEFEKLPASRQRIITQALRDFRLGGAELPPAEKVRFLEVQETLAATGARFEQNLLDATNSFTYDTQDPDELLGLPPEVLSTAAETAKHAGRAIRLAGHPACPLLPPGHAVCRTTQFARTFLSLLYHPGLGIWSGTLEQRSLDPDLTGFTC